MQEDAMIICTLLDVATWISNDRPDWADYGDTMALARMIDRLDRPAYGAELPKVGDVMSVGGEVMIVTASNASTRRITLGRTRQLEVTAAKATCEYF
jgi:hypothetical protein